MSARPETFTSGNPKFQERKSRFSRTPRVSGCVSASSRPKSLCSRRSGSARLASACRRQVPVPLLWPACAGGAAVAGPAAGSGAASQYGRTWRRKRRPLSAPATRLPWSGAANTAGRAGRARLHARCRSRGAMRVRNCRSRGVSSRPAHRSDAYRAVVPRRGEEAAASRGAKGCEWAGGNHARAVRLRRRALSGRCR